MSLDLYEREVQDVMSRRNLVERPEIGAWDGFARGVGLSAMQTFAKAGRAASMGLIAPVIAAERFTDGTELQDRFFRAHDDVFGSAVDHWTPRPDEVGVAGQITGQLLATLPMLIASPAATVGMTGLATMEDLARKGVDPGPAIATGAVMAGGLGMGIYVPILGRTLAQRVLLGGAGFNVFQGATTRGAAETILQGTPGADDFKALDPTALTLDVLLGIAFGGIAHLSPAQRAQGAKFYERMDAWSKSLKPSDVDALLILRQAQHVNADSIPGKPVDPEAMGNHAARTRKAIEQLARDERVDVSDIPEGRFEVDEPRMAEMAARADELVRAAEEVRKAEGLPSVPETEGPPARVSAEPPPPRGEGERPGGPEAKSEPVDPAVAEARRFAEERVDIEITVGRDNDGNPVRRKLKDYLDDSDHEVKLATEDTKLFQIAAACMLGGA